MARDPCNAVPESITTTDMLGGQVQRIRTRLVLHTTAASNNGYVVWFPAYHNAGTDGTQRIATGVSPAYGGGINCIAFESSDSTARPTNGNTLATALGSSTTTTGGQARAMCDPCFPFLNGNNIDKAVTLGACITARYVGATSLAAGEIVGISNLEATGFFTSTAYYATGLSTVDLFNYAAGQPRRMDGCTEVRWRPDMDARVRSLGDQCIVNGGPVSQPNTTADAPLLLSSSTGTLGANAQYVGASKAIGLAWLGLNLNQGGDLVIEMTKIVQFTFRPTTGVMERIPRPISGPAINGGDVAQELDRDPHWFDRIIAPAEDIIANGLARMVLGGYRSGASIAGKTAAASMRMLTQ